MLLLLGCIGGGSPESTKTPGDDTAAVTDTGTTTTTPSEVFELGEPSFTVSFGETWATAEGYWFSSEDFSSVKGDISLDATTVELVTLMLDGPIDGAGSYEVTSFEYVQQLSQSGTIFHYVAESPEELTLVVEGFADTEHLFAHMTGTASMEDLVGGGSLEGGDLLVTSWPPY